MNKIRSEKHGRTKGPAQYAEHARIGTRALNTAAPLPQLHLSRDVALLFFAPLALDVFCLSLGGALRRHLMGHTRKEMVVGE